MKNIKAVRIEEIKADINAVLFELNYLLAFARVENLEPELTLHTHTNKDESFNGHAILCIRYKN